MVYGPVNVTLALAHDPLSLVVLNNRTAVPLGPEKVVLTVRELTVLRVNLREICQFYLWGFYVL